jgi:hypothetical protein
VLAVSALGILMVPCAEWGWPGRCVGECEFAVEARASWSRAKSRIVWWDGASRYTPTQSPATQLECLPQPPQSACSSPFPILMASAGKDAYSPEPGPPTLSLCSSTMNAPPLRSDTYSLDPFELPAAFSFSFRSCSRIPTRIATTGVLGLSSPYPPTRSSWAYCLRAAASSFAPLWPLECPSFFGIYLYYGTFFSQVIRLTSLELFLADSPHPAVSKTITSTTHFSRT